MSNPPSGYYISFFYMYIKGNSQQKSLVLTAEEFTRLANQGVLRFDQPKPEPVAPVIRPPIVPSPPMTVASPVVSHPSQVTSPSVPVFSSHKLNIDDSDVSSI